MWRLVEGGGYSRAYRKSSIKAPLSNEPPSLISPPVQRRKVNKPPLSIKPPPPMPLPESLFFTKKLRMNVDWSVMTYSDWKFTLFLVFGGITSNFICLTFSILRSSSLWRIATIFLSLGKALYRPGTTSPSSRNLAPVGENSKLQPSRDKNLHSRNDKSLGKCPTTSWSWELLVDRR